MNAHVRITSVAWDDIREGFLWYEKETPGTGTRFWTAVKQCLRDIQRNPELGRPSGKRRIRKRKTPVFPYSIYFELVVDEIRVLAVWHGARDPKELYPRFS